MENETLQEKVTLNGKEITKEDFETEKIKLTEKKIKVVEVSANNYRTRLED